MSEQLEYGPPLALVLLQALLHEVNPSWRNLSLLPEIQPIFGFVFLQLQVPAVTPALDGRLEAGGERAQHVVDDLHLVHLTLAGEHGLRVDHLAHQTPDGPDVARLALADPQQQFRRAVPPRGHLLRLLRRPAAALPREPEVADLERVFRVEQHVFGFDVAVYDVGLVALLDGLEQLQDVPPQVHHRDALLVFLQHVQQRLVHLLEHQV